MVKKGVSIPCHTTVPRLLPRIRITIRLVVLVLVLVVRVVLHLLLPLGKNVREVPITERLIWMSSACKARIKKEEEVKHELKVNRDLYIMNIL